ncbi:MAG TPA: hypothetical protein VFQ15_05085 [Jiangellaceae bacterium]|nr:hypothetical protein [Jiangellaceae bacterium]
MPYVLTVDQRGSRRSGDLVDNALHLLAERVPTPQRAFERTAGDEFQGVLDNPADTLTAALALVRHGSWSVGIGAGPVEEPLARPTRAGRGPAFVHARVALDTAKNRPHRVAVVGPDDRAHDADVLLTLVAALISRRSDAGWEAIDLVESGLTVEAAANALGISRQAVGQRLAVALWQQVRDARPLAERLLEEAAG